MLEPYDTVLRPESQGMRPNCPKRLYQSRDVATAFKDLLKYLDTNGDGYYSPPCDEKNQSRSLVGVGEVLRLSTCKPHQEQSQI